MQEKRQKIRLYVAEDCGPCQEIKDMVARGQHEDDVEVVDIQTDSGWELFSKEVLEKGKGAVPSAYKDGEVCKIQIDEDRNLLVFDCPKSPPPSS